MTAASSSQPGAPSTSSTERSDAQRAQRTQPLALPVCRLPESGAPSVTPEGVCCRSDSWQPNSDSWRSGAAGKALCAAAQLWAAWRDHLWAACFWHAWKPSSRVSPLPWDWVCGVQPVGQGERCAHGALPGKCRRAVLRCGCHPMHAFFER